MPSTTKESARSSVRRQATNAARDCFEKSDRAIGRVAKSLEGTGASDLSKDVVKLLRDARRDVTKMSKPVRRDLGHLQKDLTAASGVKPRRARPGRSRAKSGGTPRTLGKSS